MKKPQGEVSTVAPKIEKIQLTRFEAPSSRKILGERRWLGTTG